MLLNPAIGIGAGDLQHAMRAEVERIISETKGDPLAQTKLLHRRMRELDLIEDPEVETLDRLAEISSEAASGKRSAQPAYFEARDLYNTMLASGKASPVALTIASSSVGSYTITESSDGTVVVARSNSDWEHRLTAAGALIGAYWGQGGAAIGGTIGGLVGAVVDHCTH